MVAVGRYQPVRKRRRQDVSTGKPKPVIRYLPPSRELALLKRLANYGKERKLFNFDPQQQQPGNTASVTLLQQVAQGTSDQQRIGDAIHVTSWYMRYTVLIHPSVADWEFCRVAVVQDTEQVLSTAPAYSDIFNAANPWANLSIGNRGRFKILYDKKIVLDTGCNKTFSDEVYLKLSIPTRYNGTAANNIMKNGLWLVLIGVQNVNKSNFNFCGRGYYTDG